MASLPTLSVVRGTDFDIPLEFRQPSGAPLDISGCTVFVTAKKKPDDDATDAAAVFKVDVSVHTDAANGKTVARGVPADTLASKPGEYEYDIELRDASNRVTSFGRGKFILEGELTRRA